jgi:hypothetical protein
MATSTPEMQLRSVLPQIVAERMNSALGVLFLHLPNLQLAHGLSNGVGDIF